MIKGIVFDYQNVTAKNDGQIYHSIFTGDGILSGCGISFTSNSVTVADGYFVMCGRVMQEDGAETMEIQPTLQNGYMRLRYKINLNAAPSPDEWTQGEWLFDYSATTAFPALAQEDLNLTGKVYEMEMAVFQVTAGSIAAVARKAGDAEIDAERLGGQLPAYYMPKTGGTFSGQVVMNALLTYGANAVAFTPPAGIDDSIHYQSSTGKHFFDGVTKTTPATATANKFVNTGGISEYGVAGGFHHLYVNGTNATGFNFMKNNGGAWAACQGLNFTPISARKYKENIEEVTEGQALKLLELQPVCYTLKQDDGESPHYGFIADDVAEVDDTCVVYGDGDEVEGLDYMGLIAPLTKLVQVQQKHIEGLEERLAALEGQAAGGK